MWVSKRYFLSIIFMFSFVWVDFSQLSDANQVTSDRHCILVTYDEYPKVLLNVKSGHYFVFPDGYNASLAVWLRKLSPDGKYITYIQPALEDPFGINFDLYLEEIATGERFLVAEDVAQTSLKTEPDMYILEWSPDSERVVFFNRNDPLHMTGFGLVVNIYGKVEYRWGGWFYNIQWSPNNRFLAFTKYDSRRKLGFIYIWDHTQNETADFQLPYNQYIYDLEWSTVGDRLAVISGTGWESNDRTAEFELQILTPGMSVQLSAPLNHTIHDLVRDRDLVKAKWTDNNETVEIQFKEYATIKEIERIDARTGKKLPYEMVNAPFQTHIIVDGNQVYLVSGGFESLLNPRRPEVEFTLDYSPQRVHASYYFYDDTIHPYWRMRMVRSIALVWEYHQQIYVTFYDVESKDVITHRWPFSYWKDLQLSQRFGSELINYKFDDRIGAHSGVFNARSGEFIVEFSGTPSEITQFYYQEKASRAKFV